MMNKIKRWVIDHIRIYKVLRKMQKGEYKQTYELTKEGEVYTFIIKEKLK